MKKFICLILFFGIRLAHSQTPSPPDTISVNSYAEAIDLTYGLLPTAHYDNSFLIDKAGWHYTLDYADGRMNDSIFNMYNWFLFYDKFFYSQLQDTLPYRFVQLDSLKNRYIDQNDALPFGVLDYSYYKIKDSAVFEGSLVVNSYRFSENTTDLSRIYVKSKLFCVSPLNTEVNTLNPQFTFLPELFFSNTTDTLLHIMIDFDDGLGFREVYKDLLFQASYGEAGYKNIITKFIYSNGDTLYSNSQLFCNDPNYIEGLSRSGGPGFMSSVFDFQFDILTDPSTWPVLDFNLLYSFKKATCGVWRGCGNEEGTNIRKPIIIFTGYNPKNGKDLVDNGNYWWLNDYLGPVVPLAGWRGPFYQTYNGYFTDASTGPQHYGENGSYFLDKLRTEGYDIVIVKMHEGTGYMQHYAHMVSAVIREINQRKVNSTYLNPGAAKDPEAPGYPNSTALTRPRHENIVIGYSAGALAAKMGLLLMEYQHRKFKNTSDAWKYPHHNTRIWVSYDGENQGSNVPVGFQMMLDYMGNSGIATTNLGDVVHTVVANSALNLIKEHGISTQNTLYNIVNLSYCGGNVFCIDHHADFGGFIDDLSAISTYNATNLKGYPQFLKRIGYSPGNANGLHNSISDNKMLFYESISNPCFSPSGGSFNLNPTISLNPNAVQVRGHRKAQSYFMTQANTTQVALDCKIGLSIKTLFWSWYINLPHWRYKSNGNYINNAKNYDVRAGSTLPTHIIYGRKLPFASDNSTLASVTWCNLNKVNLTLHGFCPTASALDIHEPWNTSLYREPNEALTPANQNLLFQNDYDIALEFPPHHNFGYPHIKHPTNHYDITPFDAICANGDYDATYYQNNTIHVEDPNPYVAEFLAEELAPTTLYLSNRTIWDETTGEKYYADFEARNSILAGNQEIYKHNDPIDKTLWYQRLQTSPGDFVIENNAVVTMRAGNDDNASAVVLGAGFSAKAGCIFRAYVHQSYCSPFSPSAQRKGNTGSDALPETPQRSLLAKRLTSSKLSTASQKLNVASYPNPTTGNIYYEVKDQSYAYTISDISGRVLESGNLDMANPVINLSTFNSGIYLITIKNSNYTQTDRIILQ